MTAMVTKVIDERGRLSLGKEFKEFAKGLVLVKRIGPGVLQIVAAQAVPARESWLYKNPEALRMVMEGMDQASAGELAGHPDMKAGEELVEKMGG